MTHVGSASERVGQLYKMRILPLQKRRVCARRSTTESPYFVFFRRCAPSPRGEGGGSGGPWVGNYPRERSDKRRRAPSAQGGGAAFEARRAKKNDPRQKPDAPRRATPTGAEDRAERRRQPQPADREPTKTDPRQKQGSPREPSGGGSGRAEAGRGEKACPRGDSAANSGGDSRPRRKSPEGHRRPPRRRKPST